LSAGLEYLERPARGEPRGLLVLHHGRGADERDLLPLADVLDPRAEFHIATPRAPLTLAGWPGYHWYIVPRVGYPEPESFQSSVGLLSAFHDQLWERTGLGPEQTVLGGFSMGSVMSYSLGLLGARPAPAGLLIFSGFIPVVEGWEPDFESRSAMRAFVAHGRRDPVIEVGFAHRARRQLEEGGVQLDYHETDVAHQIDPSLVRDASAWLSAVLSVRE
jgi:phospholipase/carboxylesterase